MLCFVKAPSAAQLPLHHFLKLGLYEVKTVYWYVFRISSIESFEKCGRRSLYKSQFDQM